MKMCKIFYFLINFFLTKTHFNRNGSSTLSRSKQRSFATEIYYKKLISTSWCIMKSCLGLVEIWIYSKICLKDSIFSWTFLMWALRLDFWPNVDWQNMHSKVLICSCTVLKCLLSIEFLPNFDWQMLHSNGLICSWKSFDVLVKMWY